MNESPKKHAFTLTERATLVLQGVTGLIGFDDTLVTLSVGSTALTVTGTSLSVARLSLESGEATVCGSIDALVYSDARPEKHFFGRKTRQDRI